MMKNKKKKSWYSIVIDVVLSVIAGILVLFTILTVIQRKTGKSTLGGYSVLWVETGSMEKAIPTSSFILVKESDGTNVKVNDIITYKSPDPSLPEGATITHRVININADGTFVTKGDNNPIKDFYSVSPSDVEDIYVRNLPFMSFFGRLYSTPYGFASTLGVLIIVFAIMGAVDKKEASKLTKDEFDELVQEEVKKLEEEAKKNNITSK